MQRAVTGKSLLWAGLMMTAVGCGSEAAAPGGGTGGAGGQSPEQLVEIFSWWVAPGEAEALQALVDADRTAHQSNRIFNAAAENNETAKARLAARLTEGRPPDLFQQNAADLKQFMIDRPNQLQPLDSFFEGTPLGTNIIPEVLANVTVGGHVYAMPVNIHRENALFYNKQLFATHQITPPTTVAEFLAACQKLKAAGVTPVATGYQGWILRIMFNSIAMGSMGPEAFFNYMKGGPRNDAALRTAIDVFADVIANYINADASTDNFGWTEAATAVKNGQAAMFFHGDWAKGYYVQLGWTPGVDFGVVGAPGAADMFWYGVDTFSMPVGAPHQAGAMNFLSTVGSLSGQAAFNKLKGSSPMRGDNDLLALLDVEGRATLQDLKNARFRQAVVGKDLWDTAMLTFARTRDKDALFQVYVDNPPVQ